MRGKTYTNGETIARACNGNVAVIIYGRFGNRFICEKRMNADNYLQTRGYRPIDRNP